MAQIEPIENEEVSKEQAVDVEVAPGLYLKDGVVRKDELLAQESDVQERTDLSNKHPLYGRRVVRVVPSGYSDCEIRNGRLVSIEEIINDSLVSIEVTVER